MKLNNQLCCPGCGAMFRPIMGEDICPQCQKSEDERLAALAHELESENES